MPNELQWYVYTVIIIRERSRIKDNVNQMTEKENKTEEMLSNKMKAEKRKERRKKIMEK